MAYENRRHLRIREISDVRWTILGTEVMGEGKVLNISSSGLMLITDGNFEPNRRGLLYIDAHGKIPLAYGSKKGKVVWVKPLPDGKAGYQCGIEFSTDKGWDKILNEWLKQKMDELGQTANVNILNHYVLIE